MEHRDSRQAFKDAIAAGTLSADPFDGPDVWAGNYMYMHTKDGLDIFKHLNTRKYISSGGPSVRSYWCMECPECHSDEDLTITASVRVKLVKDGTEDASDGHEWNDNSPTSCSCGFMGKVIDFAITK